jgi:hypothetical protein
MPDQPAKNIGDTDRRVAFQIAKISASEEHARLFEAGVRQTLGVLAETRDALRLRLRPSTKSWRPATGTKLWSKCLHRLRPWRRANLEFATGSALISDDRLGRG